MDPSQLQTEESSLSHLLQNWRTLIIQAVMRILDKAPLGSFRQIPSCCRQLAVQACLGLRQGSSIRQLRQFLVKLKGSMMQT